MTGRIHGKHYQLAETICEPQPIRRPPILIGGDGEKKTLRLVAQYADVWNSTEPDVDALKHKIDVLNRHCGTRDRDPGEIRRTSGGLAMLNPFEDIDGYLKTVQNATPSWGRHDQRRSATGQPRPGRLHPPTRRRAGT